MSADRSNSGIDPYWMGYAADLACRGWYSSPPNPRVGCVLVRRDHVIGEGWHAVTGGPHAERAALGDARHRGELATGATAYVTLEPCCVSGRTPPCTDALIEAGVARVVIGATDPNPAVDGGGASTLKAAGIDVTTGVKQTTCEALNPGFTKRMRQGLPRVRVKLAMTLDGRTAAANGESQWLTDTPARRDGHRLRAETGAVLVGRGTQTADDPSLSVRLSGEWRQPHPVVVDRELAIAADAQMLDPERAPIIFTASQDSARRDALVAAGAAVHEVSATADRLDLHCVLKTLAAGYDVNDVLVESGPTLAGALAEQGLVDGYVFYIAPKLIGSAGRGALDLPGVDRLAGAHDLTIERVDPIGPDWRITASRR